VDISLKDTRLSLARDGLIAFRSGPGASITCLEGSLWVTQESSIKDEVLGPGQTLWVRHEGLTIVTALAPSALVLSDDRPLAAAPASDSSLTLQTTLRQRLTRWFEAHAPRAWKSTGAIRDDQWRGERFCRAV
jgi:hypothetical protein